MARRFISEVRKLRLCCLMRQCVNHNKSGIDGMRQLPTDNSLPTTSSQRFAALKPFISRIQRLSSAATVDEYFRTSSCWSRTLPPLKHCGYCSKCGGSTGVGKTARIISMYICRIVTVSTVYFIIKICYAQVDRVLRNEGGTIPERRHHESHFGK
jgi:hypothetical protein